MTDTVATPRADDRPPRLTRPTFHGPLAEARAAALVGRPARLRPGSVLDVGCGWGELMLRVLDAVPDARGTGIDVRGEDLERGRQSAGARGSRTGWSSSRSRPRARSAGPPTWCCASGPATP